MLVILVQETVFLSDFLATQQLWSWSSDKMTITKSTHKPLHCSSFQRYLRGQIEWIDDEWIVS